MDLPPGPSGACNRPRRAVMDVDDCEDAEYEDKPPQWNECNTTDPKDIHFTKEEGFLVPVPKEKTPVSFFNLLVDVDFLENIVSATNRCACELFRGSSTVRSPGIPRFKDVTVEELKIFIALLIHMGIVDLPRVRDYWNNSKLSRSCISTFMSLDRFLIILRCLNFERIPDLNNRSSKVQCLADYFNSKMAEVYYPQRSLCIEEPTVLWRGRLYVGQHVKGKQHKHGIKLFSLCDPHGLIVKCFMYCGVSEDSEGEEHAADVVFNLMQDKLNCGHSLFMDSYYNSFSLASALLRRNTFCTGTLRLDRKYSPAAVKGVKLEKGETVVRYAEGVLVGKWKDKSVVAYISTELANDMVSRVRLERVAPLPIIRYNQFMKGVDRAERMMSCYPCEKKTLRWYKKIFLHVLQMLLLNSHCLYNKAQVMVGGKKQSLYDFRLSVVDALLPDAPKPPWTLKRRAVGHDPVRITEMKPDGRRHKQKRCRLCSSRGIRRNVTWHCLVCPDQPGFCVPHCFDEFHK